MRAILYVLISPLGKPMLMTNMADADEVKVLHLGKTGHKKWADAEDAGWSVEEYSLRE